jgi:hypothetical protein
MMSSLKIDGLDTGPKYTESAVIRKDVSGAQVKIYKSKCSVINRVISIHVTIVQAPYPKDMIPDRSVQHMIGYYIGPDILVEHGVRRDEVDDVLNGQSVENGSGFQ